MRIAMFCCTSRSSSTRACGARQRPGRRRTSGDGAGAGSVDAPRGTPGRRRHGWRLRAPLLPPPAWMRRQLPFHLYRLAFLAWFVGGRACAPSGSRPRRRDAAAGYRGARDDGGAVGIRLARARHQRPLPRACVGFLRGRYRATGGPRCDAVSPSPTGSPHSCGSATACPCPTVVRNVAALSSAHAPPVRQTGGFGRASGSPGDSAGPAPGRPRPRPRL